MNHHRKPTKKFIHLAALSASLLIFISNGLALTVSDPTTLPFSLSFGIGADFEYLNREFDIENMNNRDLDSSRIMANIAYSIHDQIAIYLKAGLVQCETLSEDRSDWGFGLGFGVKGYPWELQNGDIRIGFDVQLMRAEMDYNELKRLQGFSYSEDISWLEYQVSGVISWRAYTPLTLYTGLQISGTEIEFQTEEYYFANNTEYQEKIDADPDQFFALLWGVEYQVYEQAQLFAEIRAMSEISAAFGFRFTF